MISSIDRYFLDILRGASIFRVMMMHLGLSWFYPPYSQYIGIFFPVLFFVSGAASHNSFTTHGNAPLHLIRRTTDTVLPYYIFMLIIFLLGIFDGRLLITDWREAVNWLLISPTQSSIDYPIGQIWFIKTVLFIHIMMTPIFVAAKDRDWLLPIILILSLTLNFLNETFPIKSFIENAPLMNFVDTYSLWNALTLSACYLAGATYFVGNFHVEKKLFPLFVAFLALTFLAFYMSNFDTNYYYHYDNKSAFYVCLSILILISLLFFKNKIIIFIQKFSFVERLLIYCNKHSYALFLLHTVVLYYVEQTLSWQDLSDRPLLAVLRLLIVIMLTMVIAPPFSYVIKNATKHLKKITEGNSP